MARKDATMVHLRPWERRRYWRHGAVVDIELWRAGRLVPGKPRRVPSLTTVSDYCEAHRTRIYPDLACQFCGERPAPDAAADEDEPASRRPGLARGA